MMQATHPVTDNEGLTLHEGSHVSIYGRVTNIDNDGNVTVWVDDIDCSKEKHLVVVRFNQTHRI